jgi:hypothetical protein
MHEHMKELRQKSTEAAGVYQHEQASVSGRIKVPASHSVLQAFYGWQKTIRKSHFVLTRHGRRVILLYNNWRWDIAE